MHGEYCPSARPALTKAGSPPYARGILPWNGLRHSCYRITPVCTGNTRYDWLVERFIRDHPRMHGEYLTHHDL